MDLCSVCLHFYYVILAYGHLYHASVLLLIPVLIQDGEIICGSAFFFF